MTDGAKVCCDLVTGFGANEQCLGFVRGGQLQKWAWRKCVISVTVKIDPMKMAE